MSQLRSTSTYHEHLVHDVGVTTPIPPLDADQRAGEQPKATHARRAASDLDIGAEAEGDDVAPAKLPTALEVQAPRGRLVAVRGRGQNPPNGVGSVLGRHVRIAELGEPVRVHDRECERVDLLVERLGPRTHLLEHVPVVPRLGVFCRRQLHAWPGRAGRHA